MVYLFLLSECFFGVSIFCLKMYLNISFYLECIIYGFIIVPFRREGWYASVTYIVNHLLFAISMKVIAKELWGGLSW